MAIIEIKGLMQKLGGEEILKGIDLAVEKGEIFGLIGPSGAGKSTLMRVLTGYLKPSGGEVRVLGRPPRDFDAVDRRSIGFMPQSFVLYDGLSIRQNLNFVAGLYGMRFMRRRRRIREILEFIELWDDRRRVAGRISGGMRRRLQLAAALVHEPRLIFVDEPTANLDPILRRKFWDEFHLLRDGGRTIFVTTQYVSEAELCDRVALLWRGRLVAVGTPDELRREAFGGEMIELSLGADPGHIGEPLSALEEVGHVVEVRANHDYDDPISTVRLVVDDADVALPRAFEALGRADIRSAGVLTPSFDEVFFRLIRPG